jgi:hypothetical protein
MRVLEAIIADRGMPQAIRSDNGPEFIGISGLVMCTASIFRSRQARQARAERARREFSWEVAGRIFANLFDARPR